MMNFPPRIGVAALVLCLIVLDGDSRAAPKPPHSIKDVEFRSVLDGTQQRYVVLAPTGADQNNRVDVIVALHGHGSDRWQFIRAGRDECAAVRSFAAQHRMVLVSPDYRATTSWMGPAAEADVVQILKRLKRKYAVNRVLLCGGSMGGTGALTFAVRHPRLIDGVVSLNGTANLLEYDRFQAAIAKSFGGDKKKAKAEYRKRSAEFFPHQLYMPIATTTGGKDVTVPPDSVLRLMARLKSTNPHTLSIHRREGGHSTTADDARRALEFVYSRWQRAHPKAVVNSHRAGEVDRAEMLAFVVKFKHQLPGIVLDETDAELVGQWQYSTHTPPYVGVGYLHDQKRNKGKSSVTYTPEFLQGGFYEVRLSHCYNVRRSTNTPVTIHHADGETTIRINQQDIPKHGKLFRSLGRFRFTKGRAGWVRISNGGTDGKYVIADAIQFLPAKK